MLTLAAVQWMPCVSSCVLLHCELTVDNYQIVILDALCNDELVSEVHSLMLSASSHSSAGLALEINILSTHSQGNLLGFLHSIAQLSCPKVANCWTILSKNILEPAQPVYTAVDLPLSEGESREFNSWVVSSRSLPWFSSPVLIRYFVKIQKQTRSLISNLLVLTQQTHD